MKRSPLLLAAAAVVAVALSACSTGATGSGSDDSGASAGSFPAKVDTKFGTVEITEAPKRVVALGWGDAETALSFGVKPVGASDWLGFGGKGVGPWAEDLYGDSKPEIIETLEPDYEAIANLKPDLILDVHGSGDEKRYKRLSSIATTVGIPEGGENYLTSMEEQTTMIGEALGQPDKAKELLAQVESDAKAVADAHPEWAGKTTTVAAYTSEGWGAYVEGDGRLAFLQSLGFVLSPTIADMKPEGFSVSISSEQLDLLDADLLVAFPIFVEATEITKQPLWGQVPAVAAGRGIVIDDSELQSAFSIATPLSQSYLIENLVPLIEKAIPAS
ncbi:iron-siderophore ABC transporter substrate-binding protein [Schumannella sp. 10F1B-5-1]|uniref:iron-siderophore ABC transporter substrate-binding protein n=1 Tax=Schumannella sp. 10F1B-5-1 TaxID=2590780 RepID=UPI00113119F7|nr:iron-siderophore ABC transporter substrate-binding protein [Schumannella sp. 10F1B-5-1]TPW76884.1 iron-siderophore ABC transporter substrate-binding protein [Schumannella sp. 10F1B-5-1]